MRNSNKLICGLFFKGNGKYSSNHISYKIWSGIIRRNYDNNVIYKQNSYGDCIIDKRWYNFQVFAEWFENNYIEGFHLDKDILIKGNKIYGPETCCFVPKEINTLFVLCKSKRNNLPIGVSKHGNKYRAMLGIFGNKIILGDFLTIDEAFKKYKITKENYIKEVAEIWKNKIPNKVYLVMLNYIVEITD